ncbi:MULTISPECIES: ACP S-malonyltransferase [Clostridium]|uniref:ACP S-malonyltransferase n=1 Tax=Clostridium TaxID=1485 RepID=UPI0008255F0D|nr:MULTISPECIES: malonate decarboxylase subunit epsilon [Clostridium]PJI06872.1 malonate decarboxylase subunit epsilon [Clostridium sp. CT7]
MNTAFLFPGQGSQEVGMLHNLPDDKMISDTICEASEILKEDVLTFDTDAKLSYTRCVQLALLIYGTAFSRFLKSNGVFPDITAGHSIGSFSAAVLSNALNFSDALKLVNLRGKLMENAYPSGYGMGVILGLSETRVSDIIKKIPSQKVYIANINTNNQIVLTGSISGIKIAFDMAKSIGCESTKILKVSVPSHCELLNKVSNELYKELNNVNINRPSIPYVGNYTSRVLLNKSQVLEELYKGVSNPVLWYDSCTLMYELGTKLFIELSPGQVLTNISSRLFPECRSISMAHTDIESALILYKRYI